MYIFDHLQPKHSIDGCPAAVVHITQPFISIVYSAFRHYIGSLVSFIQQNGMGQNTPTTDKCNQN